MHLFVRCDIQLYETKILMQIGIAKFKVEFALQELNPVQTERVHRAQMPLDTMIITETMACDTIRCPRRKHQSMCQAPSPPSQERWEIQAILSLFQEWQVQGTKELMNVFPMLMNT